MLTTLLTLLYGGIGGALVWFLWAPEAVVHGRCVTVAHALWLIALWPAHLLWQLLQCPVHGHPARWSATYHHEREARRKRKALARATTPILPFFQTVLGELQALGALYDEVEDSI